MASNSRPWWVRSLPISPLRAGLIIPSASFLRRDFSRAESSELSSFVGFCDNNMVDTSGKYRYRLAAFLGALFVVLTTPAQAQVEYVDPTIGNVGILLEPTRPSVYLPYSMVRFYPMRADALDDRIESFPLTISSHRQPELFSIMPGENGAPAAYDQEKTTPYYYSTRFDDSLIRTEFSPTERCGYFRFTFPKGSAAVVLANRQTGALHFDADGSISG